MKSDTCGNEETKLPTSAIRISIDDMVALRVRTADSDRQTLQFLYQQLPREAVSLIASLPSVTPAVSIPQQNGRYPISRECPAKGHDVFVILYERKLNGRYEASKVFDRDKLLDVVQFYDLASREVENIMGGLVQVPGKYAYFAPTRAQWGVILRDGGFTVVNPLAASLKITPEILQLRHSTSTSGLIARIPVYAPRKSLGVQPIPVFSQVELTPDPNPDSRCDWTGFREFQKTRSIRSRLPDPMIPLFREWLQRSAAASGFTSWCFRKGVFFGDHLEWWGAGSRRRTMHEGIDFIEGVLPDGRVQAICSGTPVSALADGEAVAILDDFLNRTLVVRHTAVRDCEGNVFHTLYSHIQPDISMKSPVVKGQILGRVVKAKEAGAPAHLHLSGAWIPETIPASQITLEMINPAYAPIVLINFNSLLVDRRRSAMGSQR